MKTQFIFALLFASFVQTSALSQDLSCIKSETIKSWIDTGKTEFSQHQYQDALNTFKLTQGFFPDKTSVLDAQLFQLIGYCDMALGDNDLAEEAFKTACQKFQSLGAAGKRGAIQATEGLNEIAAAWHNRSSTKTLTAALFNSTLKEFEQNMEKYKVN